MAEPKKEWTIMVYMAGDNNLSEDMITAINELNAGVSSASKGSTENQIEAAESKVNFFIEYDPSHPTAGTQRYIIGNQPSVPKEPIDILKPISVSANQAQETMEESIKKFVIDGITNYPAKRYALIISGHSDAFQGRTLLLDENPPGTATLKALRSKLGEALKAVSVASLDILGFDSCVMNTLEVIYEFRDVTKYWVGSQGSIPNYTWDYRGIGKQLAEQSAGYESTDVIKVIVEKNKVFNARYSFNGRSIDISGFDMNFFAPEFIPTIENFIDSLNISLLFPFVTLLFDQYQDRDSFDEKLDFTRFPLLRMLVIVHWKCQNSMHNQSIDLLDFCECLLDACQQFIKETKETAVSEDALSEDANLLVVLTENILTNCEQVIYKLKNSYLQGASIGADQRYTNGVSMFLPWSFMAYGMSKKNYESLDFIKATPTGEKWRNFIILFTVLTQRPRPYLNLDLFDPQIFGIFETLNKEKMTSQATIDTILKLVFVNLFEGGGGVKDDPKRTRGLDDDYSYYFRRMKNIRSTKNDLEHERDFGNI